MTTFTSECPLCQQRHLRLVYQAAELMVVQCQQCQAVFQPQDADLESRLAAYYAHRPTSQHHVWHGTIRKRQRDIIDRIVRRYPGGDILDVGSGSGEFLYEIGQRGMQAVGIEPNQDQVKFAQSKGLNVILGSASPGMFPDACFDVITLFQVVEHLTDPVKALAELRPYLRPQGMLIVDVPSFNNPRFLIYRATGWRRIVRNDFIKPHVFYYTPKVLANIVRRAGYQITDIQCGRYSVKFPQIPLISFIDQITNRLKIGGIVIYAQPTHKG